MKISHVLLFHNIAALKIRIDKALEGMDVVVSEAGEEKMFLEMLDEAGNGYSLVIIDLPPDRDAGLKLIMKTRYRVKDTPILVLSDSSREKFYFEAILKGASDFIIKPFRDLTLVEKVNKHLGNEQSYKIEFITMDLNKYIKGELRKAEKGKFPLSLMLLHFENTAKEGIVDQKLSEVIFNGLSDIFWDTDVFLKFASRYYLGVFPFCDESNTKIILSKMKERFSSMQNEYRGARDYEMVVSFSSYPYDSDDTDRIFQILIDRMDK